MSKVKQNKWLIFGAGLVLILSTFVIAGCSANEFNEGVFTAASEGNERGYAEVSLTIENDEITDIQIIEYDGLGVEKPYEDYGQRFEYMKDAHEYLAAEIVGNNTWEVDTFSGATSTSDKVRQAARFALEKALVEQAAQEYFDVFEFTRRYILV